MSNFLRRLPLSRLLLLCGVLVAVGIAATALASALGVGPTPAPEPLADAVYDALSAPAPEGVSARVQLTNHLLEGIDLAGGGGEGGRLLSSPLVTGGSGRLWIAKDGRVRLELQSQQGDTEIVYDGRTLTLYDAASNTVYRYTAPAEAPPAAAPADTPPTKMPADAPPGEMPAEAPPAESAPPPIRPGQRGNREVPSMAKIEEAISHISQHATLSGAIPTDVAGQAAYTVRVSPSRNGGSIGGAELSFDAVHGVPLRAAVYSTGSSSPALELAITEISYEPVPASVFEISPPPGAKVQEVAPPKEGVEPPGGSGGGSVDNSSTDSDSTDNSPTDSSPTDSYSKDNSSTDNSSTGSGDHPQLTIHGTGLEAIAVLESAVEEDAAKSSTEDLPEGLQKVQIDGATATELPTALGTLLSFERSGVRYLLAGAVAPARIEELARGL